MSEETTTTTEADTTAGGGADTVAGGGADKPWYDGMAPEDIGFIQNKKWETPADAYKSYRELEKFHGAPADKLIKLPDELTPEATRNIMTRLGLPADTKGYEVEVPDGMTVDAKLQETMTKTAHDAGILPSQFKALAGEWNKYVAEAAAAEAAAAELKGKAELAALEKEWGAAFPERNELAKRAAKAFGADEALMAQIEAKTGAAGLIKLFANIGEKLGEDKFVESKDGISRQFGRTPEQYRADRQQLNSEISADPQRLAKYLEAKGPDYDKMQSLNKLIAGGS